MGPDGLGNYFDKLQHLVQETFRINGNQKVIILAHSMGGSITTHFLNLMSAEWRSTHIKAFVPVGSPFGGCSFPVRALISGFNYGIPLFPEDFFWKLQVNAPSTIYLLPTSAVYEDDILVDTPLRNYTAEDLQSLVKSDLQLQAAHFFDKVQSQGLSTLTAPLVDTFAVISGGIPTDLTLVYGGALNPKTPNPSPWKVLSEDGDGIVSRRSAGSIDRWKRDHQQVGLKLEIHEIENVSHVGLLRDESAIALIMKLLESI
eukprot:TRINITY_DN2916_c0_g1_i1.p1 TRINITY_DN2916_c0_g1~~TRINITY_DN2916_c0_g1_i1.p1  ORF type:complete len:259 (-),score=60.90 TRINITY_DN2916_c0_g1_i1:172-948(-)